MFEYSAFNHPCKVLNRNSWGAHINPTGYEEFSPTYPEWLNPHQKHEWRDRGLVIWNATTQVVTHLYANYALRILETMKDTDTWKTDGFVIGSPVYRMVVADVNDKQTEGESTENSKGGWVLINQITLSSKQAEEFLEFLNTEEDMLILMAADEDRDVREAYAIVVDMLLERRRKKRELPKNETREEPS